MIHQINFKDIQMEVGIQVQSTVTPRGLQHLNILQFCSVLMFLAAFFGLTAHNLLILQYSHPSHEPYQLNLMHSINQLESDN